MYWWRANAPGAHNYYRSKGGDAAPLEFLFSVVFDDFYDMVLADLAIGFAAFGEHDAVGHWSVESLGCVTGSFESAY